MVIEDFYFKHYFINEGYYEALFRVIRDYNLETLFKQVYGINIGYIDDIWVDKQVDLFNELWMNRDTFSNSPLVWMLEKLFEKLDKKYMLFEIDENHQDFLIIIEL